MAEVYVNDVKAGIIAFDPFKPFVIEGRRSVASGISVALR